MKSETTGLCEDEGCPHHGTQHLCTNVITQASDALQAMWNHFGDLSDNEMLGMPCKGALVKCRSALAAIKEFTHAN